MSRDPLVLNFGGGVDSTAIIVGLVARYEAGDLAARPDLILFADTGDELPATYENVARMSAWAEARGFPAVVTVSRQTTIACRVGYKSLSENCIENETLPSEAFGRGACSIKWKHEAMDAYLHGRRGRPGWLARNGFAGRKPVKLIGYDATETQTGKRGKWAKVAEDAGNRYRFPLVEWSWTRERCEAEIAAVGLPVPVKSACYMCPNQTEPELRAMAVAAPDLFLRALAIEEIARRGKHGLTSIEGLWRRTRKHDSRPGSWVEWARREGLVADLDAKLEALIAKHKPHLALANACCEV